MTDPVIQPSGSKPIRRPAPEIIVFEDPCKRRKPAAPGKSTDRSVPRNSASVANKDAVFDLMKARHEVRQLGIKGFDSTKKEDAIVSRLVKLGAKPPKNGCTNYKELQALRKKEKDELGTKKKTKEVIFGKRKSDDRSKSGKRSLNDVGKVDGQIGRYVKGVQVINSKDLRHFKSKTSSRK